MVPGSDPAGASAICSDSAACGDGDLPQLDPRSDPWRQLRLKLDSDSRSSTFEDALLSDATGSETGRLAKGVTSLRRSIGANRRRRFDRASQTGAWLRATYAMLTRTFTVTLSAIGFDVYRGF